MKGFGVPGIPNIRTCRQNPETGAGPPHFYFENLALAPKDVWQTMSRFLYDIEPEFVDSIHFSAAARKKGYIHNLSIHARCPLEPRPPMTIQEALPHTQKWWPSCDIRTKLNCLLGRVAKPGVADKTRLLLSASRLPPHPRIQKCIV